MKRFIFGQHRIVVFIVTMNVFLVILATTAVGLPALWLIRSELDNQALTQVSQGIRATHSFMAVQRSNLANLAILTAQRPTLQKLVQQGNVADLTSYLRNLQSGAGLDVVALCGPDQQIIAQAGLPVSAEICSAYPPNGFYRSPEGALPQGWLLASQPIPEDSPGITVIVGLAMDADLASQIRDQTGLEQTWLLDGKFVASSFSQGALAWEKLAPSTSQPRLLPGGLQSGSLVTVQDIPYLSARSYMINTGLETVVSLPVAAIESAQRKLTWFIATSILLATMFGSLIGILGARQISRPLERLRFSADALRKGDLARTVKVKTNVTEAAGVAYALEDARITLQHTLNQLRQEKAWMDHLLEAVVEGIVALDRNGRIMFFSQGAERITGWKQDQVLGRSLDGVFRLVEDGAVFSQRLPTPGTRQKVVALLKDGCQATLAITLGQLAPPEAGKSGTALVLRDVSDEEAIRRLLGDFLANIAHEFRTPLSALAASIELLMDQLPDLQPAETHELLDSIHLGVLSLQNLIDNLLEGASIEAGRFRVLPRPSGLAEIVSEVTRTMRPLADKYGQRIVVEMPPDVPPVLADARRTSQVLVNLLSNAIKWGPQGGQVTVRAVLEEKVVRVSVADQGSGIPEERRPDLFRRFASYPAAEQGASPNNRADHGAGLGLSVVKAIVEAQGGQVGAFNQPGPAGGAVFWFTLPLAETAPAA